jgi:hypothetical protein
MSTPSHQSPMSQLGFPVSCARYPRRSALPATRYFPHAERLRSARRPSRCTRNTPRPRDPGWNGSHCKLRAIIVICSFGAPGRSRTCDLCLRRAALYPSELRVQYVSRRQISTSSRGIRQTLDYAIDQATSARLSTIEAGHRKYGPQQSRKNATRQRSAAGPTRQIPTGLGRTD